MNTVRLAEEMGIPLWVTFPEKKISLAQRAPGRLAEKQRGAWSLISTGARRLWTPEELKGRIRKLSSGRSKDGRVPENVPANSGGASRRKAILSPLLRAM